MKSDNKSAILNITNIRPTIQIVWLELNCKITITRLTERQQNSIKLIWIPGHRGISGNEEVDVLAKQSILLQQETKRPIKVL